ncbi:MAG TPA: dihydroneopterin aldolase [Solimonas sp.]|nr:dihydroneopterin aldolase [Solimonas sp.]
MIDTIFIRGLEVHTVIGVYAHEQRAERPLRLDLELGTEIHAAAASDRLRDAVDYHAVAEAVAALVRAERVALLETLGERIARMLFERYPILSLRLRITKPGAVPGAEAVGLEVERRREDYAACGR